MYRHVLDLQNLSGGGAAATSGAAWVGVDVVPPSLFSSMWTAVGVLKPALEPFERYNHKAVAVGEKEAVVVGGYDGGSEKAVGDCALLSVLSGSS